MSEVVLIRHAETDLRGTFCGQSDPELNAAGEQRLQTLIQEVALLGIDRIYSSDLRRAVRTATVIGHHTGVAVELRRGLREIHFGLWEGLGWEQIERQYPDEARLWVQEFPWRSAPGGEEFREFTARVEAEFERVLAERTNTRPAVVTHRGVIEYALTRFFSFSVDRARRQTQGCGAMVIATPTSLLPADSTGVRA